LGHGAIVSGAMREVRDLAESAGIPVALTLLGLGALPASHPLNLGMMGMHGEAWVNHTIQEADLLIALGMRFRRPRHRQPENLCMQCQEDSCRDRSGGNQQKRKG